MVERRGLVEHLGQGVTEPSLEEGGVRMVADDARPPGADRAPQERLTAAPGSKCRPPHVSGTTSA